MDRKRFVAVFGAVLVLWGALAAFVAPMLHEKYGASLYERMAHNVAFGIGYSSDGESLSAFYPPLYSHFVAAIMTIAGEHWFGVVIALQVAMLAAVAASVFDYAYRKVSKVGAYVSVALVATNPMLFLETVAIGETVLYTFLIVLLVALADRVRWRSAGGDGIPWPEVAGLALVMASVHLVRPTAIVNFGLFVLWAGYSWFRGDRRGSTGVFLSMTFAVLLVLPWQVHLHQEFGFLSASSSTSSGLNLYKGNCDLSEAVYPLVDVDRFDEMVWQRVPEELRDEGSASRYLSGEAIRFARSHPTQTLHLAARKIGAFYSVLPTPLGTAEVAFDEEEGAVSLRNFGWGSSVRGIAVGSNAFVLLFGLFGFLILGTLAPQAFPAGAVLREWLPRYWLLFLLGLTALHAIAFAESRFRLPLEPVMAIAAGAFWAHVGRRARSAWRDFRGGAASPV